MKKKRLTKSQEKALLILHDHHGLIRPKIFAKAMWPDSPGWDRYAKCGDGVHKGGGMYVTAGCYLGKLVRTGLVQYDIRDRHGYIRGYMLSAEGIVALKPVLEARVERRKMYG